MEWTDERIARVKELFNAGHTGGQISRIMSREAGELVSRNMVIGKIHRLGLLRDGLHPRAKPRSGASRPPKPVTKPKLSAVDPSPVLDEMGQSFTLENARFGQCRWMTGNHLAGDLSICGNRVELGKSWCAHHLARISDRAGSKLARERAQETVPTVKALALRRAS
jgi:GcrA cell cycle regulator